MAQDMDRPLNFRVTSECKGCVAFTDLTQDFGLLTQGYPAKVRFYWASWYSLPDQTSEFIELPIEVDSQGKVLIPEFSLGNFSSGTTYSFAYGLVSADGNLLHFETEDEHLDQHSIEVQ